MEGITVHLIFGDTGSDYGSLDWLDKRYRPKKYRIHLHHTMSEQRTLEVLAHECVHIKQYASGQLRDHPDDDELVLWEGEPYEFDQDSPDYWFSPWETEAFGMQPGLYDLLIQDHNSRK